MARSTTPILKPVPFNLIHYIALLMQLETEIGEGFGMSLLPNSGHVHSASPLVVEPQGNTFSPGARDRCFLRPSLSMKAGCLAVLRRITKWVRVSFEKGPTDRNLSRVMRHGL